MTMVWILSIAIFFTIILVRTMMIRKRDAMPGPTKLPVIGNLHQVAMGGSLVYRTLKAMSDKHGPLMSVQLGSVSAVVVSSAETAKQFLRQHDVAFATRPRTSAGRIMFYDHDGIIFAPFGDAWRNNRKLCTLHVFNPKTVQSFKHISDQEISSLIVSLWNKSRQGTIQVDISDALCTMQSNIMWLILSGNSFSHMAKLLTDAVSEMSETAGALCIGDLFPCLDRFDIRGLKRRMKCAFYAFDSFAENMLLSNLKNLESSLQDQEEEENSSKSIIDKLLEISESDPTMTHKRIKSLILDMFAAGTETTTTTLEWTLSLFMKHPWCAKRVQDEIEETLAGERRRVNEKDVVKMKYLQRVVKESMRLYTVVPLALPHECLDTVSVNGYTIEKGTRLIFNVWAISRDPQVWENAEQFNPDRYGDSWYDSMDFFTAHSDFKSIPFSAGRRGCPGAAMAMPVLLLATARFLQAFDWSVDSDTVDIDMTEKMGAAVSRMNHLFGIPRARCSIESFFNN